MLLEKNQQLFFCCSAQTQRHRTSFQSAMQAGCLAWHVQYPHARLPLLSLGQVLWEAQACGARPYLPLVCAVALIKSQRLRFPDTLERESTQTSCEGLLPKRDASC